MRAIGYRDAGPINREGALEEFEIDKPEPGSKDLLVRVKAVSVNPVDVKVRQTQVPEGGHRILGFDAAGVVEAVGSEVTLFEVGDEVFYAGDITRAGTNAEYHAVDERIVGIKPKKLNFLEAAAMPLTTITAYEMLFDSFGLSEGGGDGDALLVIGGAGGVGSMMIQLAKAMTGLNVIATASREDTKQWAGSLGADHIVNHRNPLDEELASLGLAPRYVAALTHTDKHFDAILKLIAPRGHVGIIDDPDTLDITPAKTKALSISWEFMFARPMFETADMQVQHRLLTKVSQLVDEGTVQSTLNEDGGDFEVANLIAAHRLQESGKAIGKTALSLKQ